LVSPPLTTLDRGFFFTDDKWAFSVAGSAVYIKDENHSLEQNPLEMGRVRLMTTILAGFLFNTPSFTPPPLSPSGLHI